MLQVISNFVSFLYLPPLLSSPSLPPCSARIQSTWVFQLFPISSQSCWPLPPHPSPQGPRRLGHRPLCTNQDQPIPLPSQMVPLVTAYSPMEPTKHPAQYSISYQLLTQPIFILHFPLHHLQTSALSTLLCIKAEALQQEILPLHLPF